jgi:selenide,water dikinase
LLVGFETSDDASVYQLNEDTAIVTTADFITPPVDDPYLFGQIAAANSISDIYAMGGQPISCLNLVGFPSGKLGPEILHSIVAGALDKITEAGAILTGGHTTDDDEPKFGLAVTGLVHPKKYWSNAGAKPGDALILTRPIGSGVIFNANLKGWVSKAALDACIEILIALNKTAAEVLADFTVHAATDITGFGLGGHAYEMASASGAQFQIKIDTLPIMQEALEMYERGMSTGVNASNRELIAGVTRIERKLPSWHEEILFDPQTSGGLLVAMPENEAQSALDALRKAGVIHTKIIGRVQLLEEGVNLVFR